MKTRNSITGLVIALVMFAGCTPTTEPQSESAPPPGAEASASAVDHVLINGNILTVDDAFSIGEAIAIQGDRIVVVGANDEVLALAGPDTETTDLAGRTVIPGLIENHMHFVRAARDWYRHVRWDDVTSRAEALAMLTERAAELPDSEWVIVMGGWNFEQFLDDDSLFTVAELDAVLPDTPVYIQEGYRRGFANSRALEIAGLGTDRVEFAGGDMALVANHVPPVSDEAWDASLQRAIADFNEMGMTTVYDVGGNSVTPHHYTAVARAAEAGSLNMRVFHALNGQNGVGPSAEEIIAALEANTPDTTGLRFAQFGWAESTYRPMRANPWNVSQETLDLYHDISLTAARNGWQMHEHSSRDVKIRAMLDVFENVDEIESIADMRWTIAHTNGISDESIERANALGMVYAVHSSRRLMTSQQLAAEATVPPIRNIHESGGIWGLGSDGTTVASPNPFHNIGWAVTGLSPSGLKVLEATVSREAALTAHTRSNAYILFRENDLGSLEPGKLADLAVLDRDYMSVPAEELKDLRSVMTLVGGEVVYSEL